MIRSQEGDMNDGLCVIDIFTRHLFHTLHMTSRFFRIVGFSVFALLSWVTQSSQFSRLGQRDLVQLSTEQIVVLANSLDPVKNVDTRSPDSHLSKLLIPRPGALCNSDCRCFSLMRESVVGSENNTFVRQHIAAALTALNWHVEEDSFTDNTPYGQRSFTNIIATKDPTALRRVIVSAHYDSKFFPTHPENQVRSAAFVLSSCH